MSSKGQITVPKDVRKLLALEPGDEVEFTSVGDHVVMRKASSGIDWERVYGVIDFGGRTTEEVMAEIRPKGSDAA